jgi:hypothetical protein
MSQEARWLVSDSKPSPSTGIAGSKPNEIRPHLFLVRCEALARQAEGEAILRDVERYLLTRLPRRSGWRCLRS